MKNIIVIAGPTGVGKTRLSIELAKKINAEIINADSMQVYKNLNIGTAKVTEEEKEGIVHHLLDIVDPDEMYTVYNFQKDGRETIDTILNNGKRIIIVGGTGLYIKALLYDYKFKEETVTYDFKNKSNEELLNKILELDNNNAIHINNRKRLERTLTKLLNNSKEDYTGNIKKYDFVMIGLTTDRENLYKIIDKRVDKMINSGLIDEVKYFYDKKVNSKALQTGIGYKELYKYFDGKCSLNDAIVEIKKNSRRYAKRQYTFFNNQFDMNWFNTDYNNFDNTVNEVYEFINN
ncbi:MAG: tRNA (adenosine(37)-N6)-dimethylallyltransferase MiaA [bacterium]|nr:tRNA (adenosine(37)-N6)-dimethylallyltransferase MiaA [bacterium]